MKEARVRSEPQSHVREAGLVPGGNREPTWVQVGVTTLILRFRRVTLAGEDAEGKPLPRGWVEAGWGEGVTADTGSCTRPRTRREGCRSEHGRHASLGGRGEFSSSMSLSFLDWLSGHKIFLKMELCIFQTF